jgi:hypothetical protein
VAFASTLEAMNWQRSRFRERPETSSLLDVLSKRTFWKEHKGDALIYIFVILSLGSDYEEKMENMIIELRKAKRAQLIDPSKI